MKREEQRERREAMKAYKADGHTAKEVADRFGVAEGYAYIICSGICSQKSRGQISAKNRLRPKHQNNQYSVVPIEERGRLYAERYAEGFEYAGNYTGEAGTIDLRCSECDTIITRSCGTVRHRSIRCPVCSEKEKALKLEQKEIAKAKKKEEQDRNRSIVKNAKQLQMKVCKECGALFVLDHVGKAYCSDRCRKRVENRSHDRRLNGKVKDWTITLRQVYRKDGGVCYLCGGMCDLDDIQDKDGVTIAGDNYPSIDHVKPLAKGGLHEWGNVRLAHRKCNYLKSDNPLTRAQGGNG